MIVDYLVDYAYLAEELEKKSTDSPFFMGLKMLCDAVEFDNARLLADESLHCLEPLRNLSIEISKCKNQNPECRKKKSIIDRFLKPTEENHWYRKIKNLTTLELENGMELNLPPKFVIATQEYIKKYEQVKNGYSLENYYLDGDNEKQRIKMSKAMIFEKGQLKSKKCDFKEVVKRFGCSEKNFTIFDRYSIALGDIGDKGKGKIDRYCKNIFYWIKMLSNDFLTKNCEFEIWANYKKDFKDNIVEFEKSLEKNFKSEGKTLAQRIKVYLIDFEHINSHRDWKCMFHDRFICTRTRVMSVGKGLDVLDENGNPICATLQYCGRNRADSFWTRLKGLLSSQEKYYIRYFEINV